MSRRALTLCLWTMGLAGCVYDVPLLSSAMEQTDARGGGMPDDPGANGHAVADDAGRSDADHPEHPEHP